jgi:hypothetical protein
MAEQQAHTLALGVRTPADPVVSWTVHRSDTGTVTGARIHSSERLSSSHIPIRLRPSEGLSSAPISRC